MVIPVLRVGHCQCDIGEPRSTISLATQLAAGGEPSTWFPPGGLVETTAAILDMAKPMLNMSKLIFQNLK